MLARFVSSNFRTAVSVVHWPSRRVACTSSECAGRPNWHQVVNRGKTVQLQGSSFCFPLCFERELRGVLRANPISPQTARVSWRIPIGLLLLSRGALTEYDLQRALSLQKQAGTGKLGHWLQQLKLAGEEQIAAALAMQWACPLLRQFPPQIPDHKIPICLMERLRMIPVHFSNAGRSLRIAFAGCVDYPALVSVERMLEVKTEACLAKESHIEAALTAAKQRPGSREKVFDNCRDDEEIVRIISSYAEELDATEVRAVTCHEFFWTTILGRSSVGLLFQMSSRRFSSDEYSR